MQISNKFWEAPRWIEKQFAKSLEQLIAAEEKDADAFWSPRALAAETEEEDEDAVVRTTDEAKKIKKLQADVKKKIDKIVREYARLERPANLHKEQLAWRMFLTASVGQLIPNDVVFDYFDYYFSDYVITSIGEWKDKLRKKNPGWNEVLSKVKSLQSLCQSGLSSHH